MSVKKSIIKTTLSLMLFGVFGLGTLILLFGASMGGQRYMGPLIFTSGIITYLLLNGFLFNQLNSRRRVFWVSIVAAVPLIITSVRPMQYAYEKSIPTISTEVNVYDYQPFTKSKKLARLDDPASLRLVAPLPKLDGATAFYPTYAAFAEAVYPEGLYGPYDGQVRVTKTPGAYERLAHREVDVIFVAAPDGEQREAIGPQLKLTPVAKEAFVFFVNRKNPVDSLTVEQIQGIYSGEITNWKEVGGHDEPIRAFQRPAGSGSQSALMRFMGGKPLVEAPKEDVVAFMGAIIDKVAKYRNYKNAIGYSFRFYSTEMIKNGEIKLLAVGGVAPTKETIRSEQYLVTEPIYAVTAGTENANVRPLIEWILSDEGQELVERSGYVSLNER